MKRRDFLRMSATAIAVAAVVPTALIDLPMFDLPAPPCPLSGPMTFGDIPQQRMVVWSASMWRNLRDSNSDLLTRYAGGANPVYPSLAFTSHNGRSR